MSGPRQPSRLTASRVGASTQVRLTAVVMLVWAGDYALVPLAGLLGARSPGLAASIDGLSLVLLLPALILAVVLVWRGRPRWPGLEPDRLAALLDTGERPVAVIAVRIAGTQRLLPVLLCGVLAVATIVGATALYDRTTAVIFLGLSLLALALGPIWLVVSNGIGEGTARRGGRRSLARTVPRSGSRRHSWLVLTDRRLALVERGRRDETRLAWQVPRSELHWIGDGGRSFWTLDRTTRLGFSDGSSVRMAAPDARPLYAGVWTPATTPAPAAAPDTADSR